MTAKTPPAQPAPPKPPGPPIPGPAEPLLHTPAPGTVPPLGHMRPHDKINSSETAQEAEEERPVFLPDGVLVLDGTELVEFEVFKDIAVKDIDSLINRHQI